MSLEVGFSLIAIEIIVRGIAISLISKDWPANSKRPYSPRMGRLKSSVRAVGGCRYAVVHKRPSPIIQSMWIGLLIAISTNKHVTPPAIRPKNSLFFILIMPKYALMVSEIISF